MAKIKKYKNQNINKRNNYILLLCLIIIVNIALALFLLFYNQGSYYVLIISLLVSTVLSKIILRQYGILQSGLQGEGKALKLLKQLPKEYVVLANPVLRSRVGLAELDYLIIGDNGVFIVEVKNHGGIIIGDKQYEMWMQKKTTKKGNQYTNHFKNPLLQVKRHQRIVESITNIKDINCYVYFTNAKDVKCNVIEITNNGKKIVNGILKNKGICNKEKIIQRINKNIG